MKVRREGKTVTSLDDSLQLLAYEGRLRSPVSIEISGAKEASFCLFTSHVGAALRLLRGRRRERRENGRWGRPWAR